MWRKRCGCSMCPPLLQRNREVWLVGFICFTVFILLQFFLVGVEGFTSAEDHATFNRIEVQLKKRFGIGTCVSTYLIVDEFVRQNYSENVVRKVLFYGDFIHRVKDAYLQVIDYCISRGEIQYRLQRKLLYRIR